jgi:hypothetical protein
LTAITQYFFLTNLVFRCHRCAALNAFLSVFLLRVLR